MVSPAANSKNEKHKKQKLGLAHWMQRVLEECDRAGKDLAADPVHDLRVALRRCRSMADGLMVIDPDKSWRRMKRAGKPLFQALGELRDAQVMMEWVDRLGAPDDPVAQALKEFATQREVALKKDALQALQDFDRKQWAAWCNELPQRATRIRPGSLVFKLIALERWTDARKLQPQAMRSRSQNALHRLRIALKRFRYIVENFLPQLHEAWSDDLKELQDLLGEVHDLDVLWATALDIGAFPEAESRSRWHARIAQERAERVEKYRRKMVGKDSLWNQWRAHLPHGNQVRLAALNRLKLWASFLDPNFTHSQHVAALARQLYDGLIAGGLRLDGSNPKLRDILYAAALMHEVGRSCREKGHHKKTVRMIGKLTPPMGWTEQDLRLAGVIARYHRGALPQPRHRDFVALPANQQAVAVSLAGILRLVNALDTRDGRAPQLKLDPRDGVVRLYLQGYSRFSRSAENIAAARHLLETVLRRPILVRALVGSGRNRRGGTRATRPAARP